MNQRNRENRRNRVGLLPWLGAAGVHVAVVLLLQLGGDVARSSIHLRPAVEAVRVQAADERLLQHRREAHRRMLQEVERRKQREQEAQDGARLKREQAEKKQAEEDRHQAEEEKRQAAARAEEEKRQAAARAEAERKAKEMERKLWQAEQARRAEAERRERQEAALRARQANVWRVAIKSRIERFWLQPLVTQRIPCEVMVEQNENGEVLSAKVRDCRASRAWQESLRNAVLKASPLPLAPHRDLFDRRLVITFYPNALD